MHSFSFNLLILEYEMPISLRLLVCELQSAEQYSGAERAIIHAFSDSAESRQETLLFSNELEILNKRSFR